MVCISRARRHSRLRSRLSWLWVLLIYGGVAALTLAPAAPVLARQFNGNPTGQASRSDSNPADGCTWTSTLDPNPARQMSTCPWVQNGLTAQGFSAANGWNVTLGATLDGSLAITEYDAWVTTQPIRRLNNTDWGGRGPFECYGGAVFQATYTPAPGGFSATNPNPANLHWIQGLRDNRPTAYETANGQTGIDGYTQSLDNEGTPGTNPFYDNIQRSPTTSTQFLDIPARGGTCPYTADWEAQVFLASWNPAAKQITVYEKGIWWGFDLVCAVPEPATTAGTTAMILLFAVRRRRDAIAA